MRFSRYAPLGVLVAFSAVVNAQMVTVIHGSADAQACSHEARLASTRPNAGGYSVSSCTRALAYPDIYTTRDIAALHINRGIVYAAQQEYSSAFADYRTAFELKPDLPETYVNLGNLYFLGEDLDRAVEFYDKSLALGIRRAHVVHLNKGMVLERKGLLVQAEQSYRQALALSPEWQLAIKKLTGLGAELDAPE